MAPAIPIYPRNNIGRAIIPTRIINQTGYNDLYFYLVGTTNPTNPNHNWYFLSDFAGNCTKCKPTQGETSFSMQIPPDQTIQLPRLSAMRIYFSINKPLLVNVGPNGIPNSPAGWVQDADYATLFDWVELTWELNPTDFTLGGNTTQVDMFGMPFALELVGHDPAGRPLTVQGGFNAGGLRHQILGALKSAPTPWNNLVITDPTGFDLRAISPYHGMELNLFPRNQLDAYINSVWAYHQKEPLMASAEGVTYKGYVRGGVLTFSPTVAGFPEIHFPKPSSFEVYTSGPLPTVTSAKAGVIGAALQAAFMRSTLLISNSVPECHADLFYQSPPVNLYAKILHQYADGGGAYAFGFDDVCERSSFIIVHNPVSAQVTLLPF